MTSFPELSSVQASLAALDRELGPEAVGELLTAFLQDTPASLAELDRLSRGGDAPTFARAAHSLAGSCSIFGLEEMRTQALALEKSAAAGEHERSADLLAALQGNYPVIRPHLERLHAALPGGLPQ
jgi:HPt (histidine-containing phosphotransfer) domain-containing protein